MFASNLNRGLVRIFFNADAAVATAAPKKAKKAAKKGAKAAPKKKAKKASDGEGKLNAKQQKVVDYLAKHNATTAAHAIKREKVWTACDVGMGVISSLKEKGLLERVDHEDGTKLYRLTAEGKKLASK